MCFRTCLRGRGILDSQTALILEVFKIWQVYVTLFAGQLPVGSYSIAYEENHLMQYDCV
jgi:hypothetical protein